LNFIKKKVSDKKSEKMSDKSDNSSDSESNKSEMSFDTFMELEKKEKKTMFSLKKPSSSVRPFDEIWGTSIMRDVNKKQDLEKKKKWKKKCLIIYGEI